MQSHAGVRARTKTHSRVRADRQGSRPIEECRAENAKGMESEEGGKVLTVNCCGQTGECNVGTHFLNGVAV